MNNAVVCLHIKLDVRLKCHALAPQDHAVADSHQSTNHRISSGALNHERWEYGNLRIEFQGFPVIGDAAVAVALVEGLGEHQGVNGGDVPQQQGEVFWWLIVC